MLKQPNQYVIAINQTNEILSFTILNLFNTEFTLQMSNISQQQAFLFMPDISGFTKFIGETEIQHSTHIIQELLEIIINENKLKMDLVEIEGDAVFFYRFGNSPSIENIIGQAKGMFEKFHQHLLQYENRRICQCGACRTANNLTLKFIVHKGLVGSYYVRNQHKLIGGDIIILHRLLKNKIPANEYILFTKPFFEALYNTTINSLKLSLAEDSEEFDAIITSYKYLPIKHWLNEIDTAEEDDLKSQADMFPMIMASRVIHSQADKIFSYIADLSKRHQWMNEVKLVEVISGSKINQAGSVHKCILNNNDTTFFQTNYFEHSNNDFTVTEIDNNRKAFGHQFTVEALSAKSSNVRIQFLIKNKPFNKAMFNFFMKKKMEMSIKKSLDNLRIKLEEQPDCFI